MSKELKFMYNGIKINGKLIKGSWNKGGYTNGAEIAFYAKDYNTPELREYFKVKNDTDIMTDYFDTDTIYFMPNDKYITEIREAYNKRERKFIENQIKHYEKRLEKNPNSEYVKQELQYFKEKFEKFVA